MIKLFWNTHNQKNFGKEDKKIEKHIGLNSEDKGRDLGWGIYHKKNSNIWINEILKKVKYNIIENELYLKKDDILIIIDSSVEKKIDLFLRGHQYIKIKLDDSFPKYLISNYEKYKSFIL